MAQTGSAITPDTNSSSSSSEPVVHVHEVRPRDLLLLGDEAPLPLASGPTRRAIAHLRRRRDDDDLVEARLAAHLVEQRHLGHADRQAGLGARRAPRASAGSRATTRGCRSASSQSSSARSAKTILADRCRGRSRRPRRGRPSPKRSTTASLTSRPRAGARGRSRRSRSPLRRGARTRAEQLGLAGADAARDRDGDRALLSGARRRLGGGLALGRGLALRGGLVFGGSLVGDRSSASAEGGAASSSSTSTTAASSVTAGSSSAAGGAACSSSTSTTAASSVTAGSSSAAGEAGSSSTSTTVASSATSSSSSAPAAGSASTSTSTSTLDRLGLGRPLSPNTSSESPSSGASSPMPGRAASPSSTRFSESESRRRSASISMIFARTVSPCWTTSRGFSTWCCGELGDVHEALDAGDDLDEGAERDDLRDAPLDDVALLVGVDHLLPRVGLRLLEPERDPLALAVDVEHLDLDLLPDLEQLGRMVHVAPGELGDVDEAVDALEVDERPEVDDVRDRALDDVARREPVEDRLAHLACRSSSSTARRERTTLLRLRLSSITLQRSVWP